MSSAIKRALTTFRASRVYGEAERVNPGLTITEYAPKWAAEVAAMWNASRQSWGASDEIYTEERVQRSEATDDALSLDLAVLHGRVVGYCKVEKYKADDEALYVGLLNVRDDFHGQKIGKALLIRALERTIEWGYPRLDLHTWAGNTKAVPLYKKCGFFWEERDNDAHLMNFLPGLLQTELVHHYLRHLDWYADNIRQIAIEPDGTKAYDVHSYTYEWQNESGYLRVDMEREGKGMRAIETEDFSVTATLKTPKPAAGNTYPLQFSIRNTSPRALRFTFQGKNNKNIRSAWNETRVLAANEAEEWDVQFHVDAFPEDNDWRGSPLVATTLDVEGKEATVQIGVQPQLPLGIQFVLPDEECFLHTPTRMYLNVENHLDESAEFRFTLPNDECVSFADETLCVHVEAQTKRSIPVVYTLREHGFYSQLVHVEATTDDGGSTSFQKEVHVAFAGGGARFYGESLRKWHICSGRQQLTLSKRRNTVQLEVLHRNGSLPDFARPRLGKPYVDELSTMRAEQVRFVEERDFIELQATYCPHSFPELKLTVHARVMIHGIVRYWVQVHNRSTTPTAHSVWVYQPLWIGLEHALLPYDGQIVDFGPGYLGMMDVDSERLTENWLFMNNGKQQVGLTWPVDVRLSFNEWDAFMEQELGTLAPGQTVCTAPIEVAVDTYSNWQDFRAYARKRTDATPPVPVPSERLTVNGGNPFISAGEAYAVVWRDVRNKYFDGTMRAGWHVQGEWRTEQSFMDSFVESDRRNTFQTMLPLMNDAPLQTVRVQGDFSKYCVEQRRTVFQKADSPVRMEKGQVAGQEVFSVCNGVLKIKVAPRFAPALYSLQVEGVEWLHSSFPTPTQMSWWSPWSGGLYTEINGLDMHSVLQAERSAAFATLTDQYGNRWEGIRLTVAVAEHPQLKGLGYDQYFLLTPGVPLLCHFTRIRQHTGHYWSNRGVLTHGFIHPGSQGWARVIEQQNDWATKDYAKLLHGEVNRSWKGCLVSGSDERTEMLHVVAPSGQSDGGLYTNNEIVLVERFQEVTSASGEEAYTTPLFFIFSDQRHDPDQFLELTQLIIR